MTPQERDLVDKLFDRLAGLENNPRDAEAERAVAAGLSRAPHAIYALVQTVLVQDEALKQADEKIAALEAELDGGAPQQGQNQQGGFLDTMRNAVFGRTEPSRGAVPSVPAAGGSSGRSAWENAPGYDQSAPPRSGYGQPGYAQAAPGGYGGAPAVGYGGSFLGTAAAAAAGMVGGSLLMNSFRSMFGGAHNPQALAQEQSAQQDRSPWSDPSGNDASNSDLAQQAGLGDIGAGNDRESGQDRGLGLFDSADSGQDNDYDVADTDDGFDDGGDDSDYA